MSDKPRIFSFSVSMTWMLHTAYLHWNVICYFSEIQFYLENILLFFQSGSCDQAETKGSSLLSLKSHWAHLAVCLPLRWPSRRLRFQCSSCSVPSEKDFFGPPGMQAGPGSALGWTGARGSEGRVKRWSSSRPSFPTRLFSSLLSSLPPSFSPSRLLLPPGHSCAWFLLQVTSSFLWDSGASSEAECWLLVVRLRRGLWRNRTKEVVWICVWAYFSS